MESMNDIIAELRSVAFSMKVHDAMMSEVYDILCGVAFRLEAAWKRECEKIAAETRQRSAADSGCPNVLRDTGVIIVQSAPVGNAAALREALREVQERCVAGVYSGTMDCYEALGEVEAALAEPARNCDCYKDADSAYIAFCGYDFAGKDISDSAFIAWLFDPATKEEGNND